MPTLNPGAGFAAGIEDAGNTIGQGLQNAGLQQILGAKAVNDEKNKQRGFYMDSYNDFIKNIDATADNLKIALERDFPHLTPAEISAKVNQQLGPALKHAKDMFSTGFKHLGLDEQSANMDMALTNIIAAPSSVTKEKAMAAAKEPPAEAGLRQQQAALIKASLPVNPDIPGAGSPEGPGMGGAQASFSQRFAAAGGTPSINAGEQYLKNTVPRQDQEAVKSLANYDVDPNTFPKRTARGMTKSRYEQMLDYAYDYAKSQGETFKPRAFKVVQDFLGSGKHGDLVRSLNVVTDHLQTVKELGAELKNGNYQAANQILNRWAAERGLPAPTNFALGVKLVGIETVKAMGVAGAGTKEDREDLARAVSTASSPDQIIGAIDRVASPLLSGQLRGLRNQFESAGGPVERFNKALFPATRRFLDSEDGTKKKGGGSGEWEVKKLD